MEKLNRFLFRRKYLVIGILAAALLIGVVGGSSAKYVQDVGNYQGAVRAKEFYFSSDLLVENGTNYVLNPGTESITFELRNFDDALRHSEENVTFTVTASNGAVLSKAEGTLAGDANSSDTVTLSNLKDGQVYTVTATGKAGYEKILTATFEVKAPGTNAYKYLETDPSGAFVLLTVWTENLSGDVKICFPAGLIPDATDTALAGIHNYKDGNYLANTDESGISQSAGSLGVYSSHTYRFFLNTPYAFPTVDNFTVTVNGTTAEEKIPS